LGRYDSLGLGMELEYANLNMW